MQQSRKFIFGFAVLVMAGIFLLHAKSFYIHKVFQATSITLFITFESPYASMSMNLPIPFPSLIVSANHGSEKVELWHVVQVSDTTMTP